MADGVIVIGDQLGIGANVPIIMDRNHQGDSNGVGFIDQAGRQAHEMLCVDKVGPLNTVLNASRKSFPRRVCKKTWLRLRDPTGYR